MAEKATSKFIGKSPQRKLQVLKLHLNMIATPYDLFNHMNKRSFGCGYASSSIAKNLLFPAKVFM